MIADLISLFPSCGGDPVLCASAQPLIQPPPCPALVPPPSLLLCRALPGGATAFYSHPWTRPASCDGRWPRVSRGTFCPFLKGLCVSGVQGSNLPAVLRAAR